MIVLDARDMSLVAEVTAPLLLPVGIHNRSVAFVLRFELFPDLYSSRQICTNLTYKLNVECAKNENIF